MSFSVTQELARFDAACAKLSADARFKTRWLGDDILFLEGAKEAPKGALIAATHGNEPQGIQVLSDFIEKLLLTGKSPTPSLFFILGNREAYQIQQRYVECDLNRQYGSQATHLREERRAGEIRKALDQADFSVDLHQTVEPSRTSFYIVPEKCSSLALCQLLDPALPVILNSFSDRVTTSSSYMVSQGKIGITLELTGGDRFCPDARNTAATMLNRLFSMSSLPLREVEPLSAPFKIAHVEPYVSGEVTFKEGLYNFDSVLEGEQIGVNSGVPLIAPLSGPIILYPSSMLKPSLRPIGTYFILTLIQYS